MLSGDAVPQYDRSALITIDVQRDFLDGQPFEIHGTSAALPAMARLVEPFRRSIVEQRGQLVRPGSDGSQLAAPLLPTPNTTLDAELLLSGGVQMVGPQESIIYKPRWGAFFGTRLEQHLSGLTVSTLVFAGCNFPNCLRSSIYEASERDFRIVVIEDAMSGLYDRGRTELENIGVRVLKTDSFLKEGV